MPRFILIVSFVFLSLSVFAQQIRTPIAPQPGVTPGKAEKSEIGYIPFVAELRPEQSDDQLNFVFRNMEEKESPDSALRAIKNSYPDKRTNTQPAPSLREDETNAINLGKGAQYDANTFDGSYPPDNTIAVSADGWKVAVVNSSIRYYDPQNQMKLNKSIESFIDDPSLTGSIFDPRVLYDSGSDRFFLCELHGSTSASSKILLMFSKSGNPMDGWNYYSIPVSQNISNRWADFPNIGVSNNEVYVTVNLFSNVGNFDKVGLYQINKNDGYNNSSSLTYQFWTNILDDSGMEPFTLVPVSNGRDGNYGPGIILVATPSPSSGSRIQVFDLTQDITAINETINGYHVNIPTYQIGANAEQPQGESLDVGDARMKHAFFQNNVVHCVFTVAVNSQGYNGINYSRINLSGTLSSTNKRYSETNVDLAYPSVASFSNSDSDPTVVIYYETSSTSSNPACKAIICDASQNFGTPIVVKAGASSIDVEDDPDEDERWGDYSGISRRPFTQNPSVWVFGIYGRNTASFGVYGNNICELVDGDLTTATPEVGEPTSQVHVFPNPVPEYFTVRIESAAEQIADIALYDATGKLIRHFATKAFGKGAYDLGFNVEPLAAGLYFLRITSDRQIIANEKIVVQ